MPELQPPYELGAVDLRRHVGSRRRVIDHDIDVAGDSRPLTPGNADQRGGVVDQRPLAKGDCRRLLRCRPPAAGMAAIPAISAAITRHNVRPRKGG